MPDKKHPIIARGEMYVESIKKKFSGGDKERPYEYQVAKQRIIDDINHIESQISNNSEVFLNEKIVCVRMESKFEAKSYVPTTLQLNDNINIVGGRKYTIFNDDGEEEKAKLYFLRTDNDGIKKIQNTLLSGIKDNVKNWRDQICSIHSIDLLTPEEKLLGFKENWKDGMVEIILHPMDLELEEMLELFYDTIGLQKADTSIKVYKGGLTFISAKCSEEDINRIKIFNPLRTIHPMGNNRLFKCSLCR